MTNLTIGPVTNAEEVRVAAGYGQWSRLITWSEFTRRHLNSTMHPEFKRRLAAAIWWFNTERYQDTGLIIGIGSGGPRSAGNPVSAASRANQSFHQLQRFHDNRAFWMAADLVAWRGEGLSNRSPRWSEMAAMELFGLHAFIGENTATTRDDEPWHVQCIEVRGWQGWVTRGQLHPITNRPFHSTVQHVTPGSFAPQTPNPGSGQQTGIVTPSPTPTPTIEPHNKTIAQKATTDIMKALPVLDITSPGPDVANPYVMRLQALLNLMEQNDGDTPIKEDGKFGPITEALVKEFQGRRDLAQDGVVGKRTWAAVMGVPEAV